MASMKALIGISKASIWQTISNRAVVSDITVKQLEHYTLFQDGRTQQGPNLSDEVYAADDLSWHCEAWHPYALFLENGRNQVPEMQ